MNLENGILCVIEGIDGSGKTVLSLNLAALLRAQNFPVILTKEPGDSELGIHLRKVLQEHSFPICPKATYLLYAADRAQHFHEVVIPALKEKKIIISDRLGDSSLVYQGYGQGLSLEMIKLINNWAMQNLKPSFTFYVQIDEKTAQERLQQRGKVSNFDKHPPEFFKKLINGFDMLYKTRQDVVILDGNLPPDQLAQKAFKYICQWIQKQKIL